MVCEDPTRELSEMTALQLMEHAIGLRAENNNLKMELQLLRAALVRLGLNNPNHDRDPKP